jgi:hypothetical protein
MNDIEYFFKRIMYRSRLTLAKRDSQRLATLKQMQIDISEMERRNKISLSELNRMIPPRQPEIIKPLRSKKAKVWHIMLAIVGGK